MTKLIQPELGDDEVFFPLGKDGSGLIVPIDGLLRMNGEIVANVDQYGAVRKAHEAGGFVLSAAEDRKLFDYAMKYQDDSPLLRKYLEETTHPRRIRYYRTQVHNLNSKCPIIVNLIAYKDSGAVGPDFDNLVRAPWLVRVEGCIKVLDEETGLPKGLKCVMDTSVGYYSLRSNLDIAAVIRGASHGFSLKLDADSGDEVEGIWMGISFAKRYNPKSLEERTSQ